MKVATITPAELFQIVNSGREVEILDVRTPAEYEQVKIPGSINVPLNQLDVHEYMRRRKRAADEPVYVLCKGGVRARTACERFLEAGYPNVVLIEGGIMSWESCGFPVERQVPNVEHQVRLVVGALNLIGVALGAFVNPWFLLISAFLGCGLIYAGLTGKCPMADVIARMPWNRAAMQTACCANNR